MKNQIEVESWVDNYSSLNSELKLFVESGKKYMILTINKYAESFSMFVDTEPDLDDVYITSFINEDMRVAVFQRDFSDKGSINIRSAVILLGEFDFNDYK